MDILLNIKNKIPVKLKNSDDWSYFLKRIIYIISFIGLCLIDQMIGSKTGYIQYGYKNYTGIIIGVIMLTVYRLKDFMKLPYLIWIVVFFVVRILTIDWLKERIYNDIELETNLWGILLYGILLLRVFYLYVVEKQKLKGNWKVLGFCLLMLIGMALIRTDYAWTKALLGTFWLFYLTDFKEKDLNNLFSGMVEGIIIGFFIIQVQAWMYRPYDMLRYEGMYSHPNMNALLYLCAYSATLCKWYMMKLKNRNVFLRIPYILMAGLMIGTMFFTGSRTAFITAIFLTLVFLFFQVISCRKGKIVEFLIDGVIVVSVIAVSILPSYWLIRYIPVRVNEPLYFETDYANELNGKILKGDPIDSEKYVELGEAADDMFGRYLWFLDNETYSKVVRWIRDLPESLVTSLKVNAAEFDDILYKEGPINQWDYVDNNVNQYVHPMTGTIFNSSLSYRVSNLIPLQNVCCVVITNDVAMSENRGWRFLDEKKEVIAYGRFAQDENEHIIVIPEEAAFFQFTWRKDLDINLKVEFTEQMCDNANIEVVELGSDREHPLVINENNKGTYDGRIDIYMYFIDKLKLVGEKNNIQGVWLTNWYQASHCHNLFLQIAYDFGIIIGIMFILVVLIFYFRVIIGLIRRRSGSWYYRLFVATMYVTLFIVFGMFEIDWTYGQLPFTMFFLMQYVVYHQPPERMKQQTVVEEASEPELSNIEQTTASLPELEIEEL